MPKCFSSLEHILAAAAAAHDGKQGHTGHSWKKEVLHSSLRRGLKEKVDYQGSCHTEPSESRHLHPKAFSFLCLLTGLDVNTKFLCHPATFDCSLLLDEENGMLENGFLHPSFFSLSALSVKEFSLRRALGSASSFCSVISWHVCPT